MSHETVTDTDTLANLRDVGGLRCLDSRVTKTGVLYRSDAPYVGDTNPLTVEQWPPTVVVDLRSLAEVNRNPFDWSSETVRHHLPLHDGAAPTEEIPRTWRACTDRFSIPHRIESPRCSVSSRMPTARSCCTAPRVKIAPVSRSQHCCWLPASSRRR